MIRINSIEQQEKEQYLNGDVDAPPDLKNDELSALIKKTNRDIRVVKYTVKRMVTTDNEIYTVLNHNSPKVIEMLEGLPVLAKIDLPKVIENNNDDYRLDLPVFAYV